MRHFNKTKKYKFPKTSPDFHFYICHGVIANGWIRPNHYLLFLKLKDGKMVTYSEFITTSLIFNKEKNETIRKYFYEAIAREFSVALFSPSVARKKPINNMITDFNGDSFKVEKKKVIVVPRKKEITREEMYKMIVE